MSTKRMEQFQREATVMQLLNHAKDNVDDITGSHSFIRILWYVLFGLRIQASNQKQGEGYSLQSFQDRLNATMWMVGCVALGLGLLIGGFLYSNFGLLPIVLLSSIILVVVSLPILLRSILVLSKHTHVPSH
jgi:hypothetical protein